MLELRIATYNVENLFGRAKAFVDAPDLGFAYGILGMIDELDDLLKEKDYTEARKERVLELCDAEGLKDYIEVREDRG